MSIIIKNLNKDLSKRKSCLERCQSGNTCRDVWLIRTQWRRQIYFNAYSCSLMEPTSGQVEICGYDLMKQRKEIRGILGYLPQDFRFLPNTKRMSS